MLGKNLIVTVVAAVAVFAFAVGGYKCGASSRDAQVSALAVQVAQNEKTVEIKDGLYATKIVELNGLQKLLDSKEPEIAALQKQLNDSKAQLLTTQQLVVTWKKAYEGAVNAHQTDGGKSPIDSTIERKRVDFDQSFGPIGVNGFTLTDPAEGFVSIKQLRPLKLTVAVAKNKDGTWQSYVTSSEPTMQVSVALSGVDTGVVSPEWQQRLWLNAGVDVLGDKRATLGLSYNFDRMSVGVSCSAGSLTSGCGITAGFRLFK